MSAAAVQPDFWDQTGPLAVRYTTWRQSAEGHEAVALIAQTALDQARAGTKRISINALFESFRAARRVKLNNSWRSFVARELRDCYPELRDRIEIRVRDA